VPIAVSRDAFEDRLGKAAPIEDDRSEFWGREVVVLCSERNIIHAIQQLLFELKKVREDGLGLLRIADAEIVSFHQHDGSYTINLHSN
jgi:hypothetical protein